MHFLSILQSPTIPLRSLHQRTTFDHSPHFGYLVDRLSKEDASDDNKAPQTAPALFEIRPHLEILFYVVFFVAARHVDPWQLKNQRDSHGILRWPQSLNRHRLQQQFLYHSSTYSTQREGHRRFRRMPEASIHAGAHRERLEETRSQLRQSQALVWRTDPGVAKYGQQCEAQTGGLAKKFHGLAHQSVQYPPQAKIWHASKRT